MKIILYLSTFLFLLAPINYLFSQDIEVKLSGNTANQGFSIKDNLNNTLMRVTGEGNVGIGITNPKTGKLVVDGLIHGGGHSGDAFRIGDDAKLVDINIANTIGIYGLQNNSVASIKLGRYGGTIFGENGNIGIGTSTTNGYKLAIAGNVIAEEIVVKLKSDWPDYVFKSDYEKPKIEQLENFINKNGHLPNIPDAEEINKQGVNIGEIQKKLLTKIEELTLYLIEQNKKIEKLENDYESLKKKINSN
jgi:hypothetical protein